MLTQRFAHTVVDQSLWEFPQWGLPQRPTIKILVVVDGSVGLDPTDYFGVGKIVEILRKNAPHSDSDYSYVRFDVATAARDDRASTGIVQYNNFRFDQAAGGQPVINQFHQIWCFGFNPGNADPTDPSDALIEAHPTRVSDSELRTLTKWMNERGGGVLAMGDHHYLGATLAWKIPRVRAMRRWTNADGVPPVGAPIQSGHGPVRYRHDTNQPQNANQSTTASPEDIPNSAEEDGIPQQIHLRYYGSTLIRPHPILCTRVGAMNVLPDHPHEGGVREDDEVPADITYDFGAGVGGLDFPNAVDGGERPLPQAIAWARPWPEPPYAHAKQPTPVTQFAVIGAYDGHRANVGRVVVDSTWHHWFNMNTDGIEAIGGDNWTKIKSYYRNIAVWLSPPAQQYSMLTYATFWSTGSAMAIEGYHAGMPSWELGATARDILGRTVNSCTYLEWVRPLIPTAVLEGFFERMPDGCLTCPPWPMIENAVLGGIIKLMLPERDRLIQSRLQGKVASVDVKQLLSAVEKGSVLGINELRKRWEVDLERSKRSLSAFDKPSAFAEEVLKQHLAHILDDLRIVQPRSREEQNME